MRTYAELVAGLKNLIKRTEIDGEIVSTTYPLEIENLIKRTEIPISFNPPH